MNPRSARWFGGLLTLVALGLVGAWWIAGSYFMAPATRPIPDADRPEGWVDVRLIGPSGILAGWLGGDPTLAPCALLVHGQGGDRRSMINRAPFFEREGFAVLAIDLRAHGESEGRYQTFGYLEQDDVTAAVAWLRQQGCPSGVVVDGFSLGAASTLLAAPEVDALVLEASFPSLHAAALHRLETLVGSILARVVTPVLLLQMPLRLGFSIDEVRPVDAAAAISVPALVIGGANDERALPEETRAIHEALFGPKELWLVPGAPHANFHRFDRSQWETRVGAFLRRTLPPRDPVGPAAP